MKKKSILFVTLLVVAIIAFPYLYSIGKAIVTKRDFVEFDQVVVEKLKEQTHNPINYFGISDFVAYEPDKYKILKSEVDKTNTYPAYFALRGNLPTGYIPFYTRWSETDRQLLCIMKTNDQYDILRAYYISDRYRGTLTDELVEKLKKMDEKYGVTIIGADRIWVHILFSNIEGRENEVVKDLVAFCPDIPEQWPDKTQLFNFVKDHKEFFVYFD